jgi:trimeric autotransporter adhesin
LLRPEQVVGLSGVGSALKITPASLNFGTLDVGVTSTAKQVLVVNLGSSPINLNSISASAAFAVAPSSTCGNTLGANAVCTVEVTFTPTAAGTLSGSLTINSSDPVSPSTVKLSGIGTIIQLAPATLSFGSQGVGNTSSTQSAVLTNLGTAAVNISSIQVTGADPGDFAIQPSSTCSVGTPVPPTSGNSCSIVVAFQPAAAGARSATLSTADNGGGSQSVSLKGTGVATLVSITVTPASPTLAVGSTQQFTATGTYSDSTTKNLSNSVTWSSPAIGVATVSNASGTQGQALAIAAGSTDIVATFGTVSGIATPTVTP